MGMAAGGNIGDAHGMFEPIHGSSPKHAGKDEVNPMAMALAVQMMLEWLGPRGRGRAPPAAAASAEEAGVGVPKRGEGRTRGPPGHSGALEGGTAAPRTV